MSKNPITTDPAGQYSSPYLGMGNNPITMVDPDGGFTDFINKQTGEHVNVDDDLTDIFIVDNAYWGLVQNYTQGGMTSFDSGISGFSRSSSLILNDIRNVSAVYSPNEFSMFQFPESGRGFARYTTAWGTNNGNNENYTVNGITMTTDNWASRETFISFYGAIQEFHDNNNTIIHYGDISAYDPSIDLGHSTHFTGNSIDIHYFTANGEELYGDAAYSSAGIESTNAFFLSAENHGFTNNYSYGNLFTHQGNNNHDIHKNHLHIGR